MDGIGPMCVKDLGGSTEPGRRRSKTKTAELGRAGLCADGVGPRCRRSRAGKVEPGREELFGGKKGSRCVSSITDREETGPMRDRPKIGVIESK